MKKILKLFMAVAIMVAGFACTTDATKDLAVELGKVEGQTTLTLSLEESRTQLGSAVAGLYPVTWSEGDKISVNGVESSSIVISENAAVATFTFNEVLSYPYAIAYPAAAAGKVVFADQQPQSEGTFANGAAAMYGYKSAEGGLALNHLTGVLKIGVVGTGAINFVQISTVDRAPIAGEFAIDFATGELTPTSASKYQISASFEESADGDAGLALSSEPKYLHFTVPAGQYDELYVTLYDADGGVMYATVKADDTKPLVAGKVRAFSNNITYAPNATAFVIRDKETLKAFAAEAPLSTKDALFVADVDMTGETWTPIEDYAGTVHGNGYAIKGLTAPLFGRVFCSIKGLHLTDVNIEETSYWAVGALARHITAAAFSNVQLNDTNPVVEHCSVSGKVVLNNSASFVDSSLNDYCECVVAGLIGRAYGVQISDCVNNAAIEVKQFFPSSHAKSLYPCVGGIAGYISYAIHTQTGTDVNVYSSMNNLVNHGTITVADTAWTGETNVTKYSYLKPYIGGVGGCVHNDNKQGEIHHITNYGDVTLSGVYGNGITLSGTFGYIATLNGSHIYNHGDLTIENLLLRYIYIGGGVGYCGGSTVLDNVHNYGAVTVAESATCASIICGGLIAYQPSSAPYPADGHGSISNSSNSGPVTVLCQGFAPELHDGTALYYRVGGLSGWTQHYMDNCNNLEGGKVTCVGTVHNQDSSNYSVCVAGLVGYKTVNPIDNSHNDAAVDVKLNMTTQEGYDLAKVRLYVGGISGYTNLPCRNVVNNGNVDYYGDLAGQLRLAGVLGQGNLISAAFPSYDDCVNNGNVTIKDGSKIGGQLMIGGVAAYIAENNNCTNNGTVTIGKNVSFGATMTYIGAAMAYVCGANVDKIVNNGPLVIGEGCVPASTITHIYIGGAVGYDYAQNVTNLENTAKGTITVEKSNLTPTVMVGGCLGCAPADKVDGKTKLNYLIENFTNRAAVTYNAVTTTNKAIYVGGTVGYSYEGVDYHAPTTKNMFNYGAVKVEGDNYYDVHIAGVSGYFGGPTTNAINYESGTITFDGTTRRHVRVAGITYGVKDSATDLVNYGDISINGKIGHTLYGAGCITTNNNYTRTRNSNHGDIVVNAEIATNNFVGGLTYDTGANMRFVDCHNTGNLILGEKSVVNTQTRWGGFVGKLEKTAGAGKENNNIFDGCSNSGDIIIKGIPSKTSYISVGGIYGAATGNSKIIILNGLTNSGDVIVEGSLLGDYVSEADSASAKYVMAGGFAGWIGDNITFSNADNPSWTGSFVNTGTIKFTGSTKGIVQIGGIAGRATSKLPVIVNGGKFVNKGDIVCTGTFNTAVSGSNCVGGIIGYTNQVIENAEVHCNIHAQSAQFGMITGAVRSDAVIAKNCKVGGNYLENVTGEDSDGNTTTTLTEFPLDESNWMNYIYGGVTTWPAETDYDGCSFLSSKDDIVIPPVVEEPAPEPTPEA